MLRQIIPIAGALIVLLSASVKAAEEDSVCHILIHGQKASAYVRQISERRPSDGVLLMFGDSDTIAVLQADLCRFDRAVISKDNMGACIFRGAPRPKIETIGP